MVRLALFSIGGGAFTAALALLTNSQSIAVLSIGLILAGIEMGLLATAAGGFTPVMIPVIAVNSVMLSSMFLWDRIREESIVSIKFQVTESEHIQASIVAIVFSAAFSIGALATKPRAMSVSISQLGDAFPVPNGALIAAGFSGIALTVFARQDVLLKGLYNEVPGPEWAASISNAATPLAMLSLCIAAARPGRGRTLATIGVAIWFLILFGRASRTIAALPAMIVFARAFAANAKIRTHSLLLAAGSTVVLLQLPLVGRANPDGVGIFPLSEQLLTRPGELFDKFSLGAILGNILFSGPLTAVVANRPITTDAFWVSINPLPGGMTDWPNIKDSLRITKSTPYNAIGELSAHGWIILVTTSAAIGVALALSTRIASNLRGAYGLASSLMVMGVTAFFSVSILQYNLRSSVRLIWYILFGLVAIWLVSLATSRSQAAEIAQSGKRDAC